MRPVRHLSGVALVGFMTLLAGCDISAALSGTASAEKVIEDRSEAELGIKVTSVSCEEAPADATYTFTCEGDSDLGPIRFRVDKTNNVYTYAPVNVFTEAEAANLQADIIANLGVSDLDCGGAPPYYAPIDTMSIVCTATAPQGFPTEITVTIDEAKLEYSYQITR